MAESGNNRLKIEGDAGILGDIMDNFGMMHPDDYHKSFVTPKTAVAPTPQVPNLTEFPTLRRYGAMDQPDTAETLGNTPLRPVTLAPLPPPSPLENVTVTPKSSGGNRAMGILGKIGEVAGSAIVPNLMKWVPGTEQHEMLGEERGRVAAKSTADIAKEGAETEQFKEEAEARKREYSAPKMGTAGYMSMNPESNEFEYHPYPEGHERPKTLDQAESDLFNAQVKAGMDPYDVLGHIYEQRQKGLKPAVTPEGELPLGDRVKSLNDALTSRYQILNPKAPLPDSLVLPNNATQKDFDRIDKLLQNQENASATQAQRAQIEEMRKQTLALRETTQGQTKEKTSLANREKVLTHYEPVYNADSRLKLMEESLPKALAGDQQAMVNLLANHVNMVMGVPRGRVGRPSQAVFEEARKSSPLLQSIEAKFDKRGYLTGVTLTPEQMKSMVDLGRDTFNTEKEGADSKADYLGIPAEDRPTFSHSSTVTVTPKSGAPPAGATHKALGSDGKMHYTNKDGKDLGPVQY